MQKTGQIFFQGKAGLPKTEINCQRKKHQFITGYIPGKIEFNRIILPGKNILS